MNEIVRYHNDLNNISLGGLSENQINILFTIFANIKDKGTQELNFELDKIIKLSGISITNKEHLELTIFRSLDKLQNLKIRYVDKDNSKVQEVVFPRVRIDENRTILSVKVSKAFAYIFNELVGNFTKFELAEFVNLDGKYAKTLYRLLKQYRKSGIFKMSWDKFTEIMDIPTTYATRDIEKIILKPAIKQLSAERNLFDQKRTPFENLSYKKTKTKGQGNKITGIEFYFLPQVADTKEPQEQTHQTNINLEKQQEFESQFYGKKIRFNGITYQFEMISKTEDNKILARLSYYENNESKRTHIFFQNIEQIKEQIQQYEEKEESNQYRLEIEKTLKKQRNANALNEKLEHLENNFRIHPLTGEAVSELNAYIGRHFKMKNQFDGGYDICKITNLYQAHDNRIYGEAINQENGKTFGFDDGFDSIEHLKNALLI